MFDGVYDNFYASVEAVIPAMLFATAFAAGLPFALMALKGRIMRGIELTGNMFIGFLALMSIFCFPLGIAIFWGVYKEALSHYISSEQEPNNEA